VQVQVPIPPPARKLLLVLSPVLAVLPLVSTPELAVLLLVSTPVRVVPLFAPVLPLVSMPMRTRL
jgi:hypothetical protein